MIIGTYLGNPEGEAVWRKKIDRHAKWLGISV